MKITQFKIDGKMETEGVWVPSGGGLELKIARIGNLQYQNYMRKIGKPYSRQLRHGHVDASVLDDLTMRSVAKHILLGWRNLQDADGKDIEHSAEKALELLKEYRGLYEMVLEIANDAELFRQEEKEDSKGN